MVIGTLKSHPGGMALENLRVAGGQSGLYVPWKPHFSQWYLSFFPL